MGELQQEMNEDCLCEALGELKKLQDFIIHSRTKYFGKLMAKIAGVDTIPFFLITKEEPLKLRGLIKNKDTKEEECFSTPFFRIEEFDKENCCATVSLLLPLDIKGNFTDSICDVMTLKRTSNCVTVDLKSICAIQCFDVDLLKRKIIIEPKW
ncbi:CotY/CotZ family spore coat protein [Bacillus dakarensis]|uniref:CotY/CotZ family spore coat protein n=1 Tax=Robertmurraya dakarensis TaxID=1926278 RepID=UPI001F2778A4|nr:CotY/CotZ family spore coat protein [Bacillus dakarensis]